MFPFDAQKIHEAALAVLKEVGVVFHSQPAMDIFRRHGVKIDGNYVYIRPDAVQNALNSAPAEFILQARNNQAVIIAAAGIMGATTPLLPAGHITVQTACFLAGLVLTQLANPGSPAHWNCVAAPSCQPVS